MFRRNKQTIIYLAQKDDETREKKNEQKKHQSKLLFPYKYLTPPGQCKMKQNYSSDKIASTSSLI